MWTKNKYILKSQLLQGLVLVVQLILMVSCAQVVRPTGGPTDNKAPQVLKYLPEDKSLAFKGKSFSILFDEFIVVKDPNKQWIISPPLRNLPEYKIKGKMLTISFDDTLKENTTYNFNLGKSIIDLNEGNQALGLNYIFSTGTFIDSLKISGTVSQAFNNSKEKEVLVMLYEEFRCKDDSFAYKQLPDYFALTDINGNYTLDYIKPGKYKAIALKDANSNYLFDNFEELIGMCDTVINLKSNINLDFKIFKEIEEKTYLKNKSNVEYGCFSLMFNKALLDIEIIPLHKIQKKDWAFIEISKFKDTVNIFLSDFSIDTLKLAIKTNNKIIDTVEFAVLPKEKFAKRGRGYITPKPIIKITPLNGSDKDFNIPISLTFNHPITFVNNDSIVFMQGKSPLKFKLLKKDSIGRYFEITCNLINDSSYNLTLLPGAFTDCFNSKNDTVKSNFKVPNLESVGNLFLSITADSTKAMIDFKKDQLLLQLFNEKNELIQSQLILGYGTISYLNFKPGIYKAQIVVDTNKNKQWDTGNLIKKTQAENIIFMKSSMSLRANWDFEEEWKISPQMILN
jgi:hypothetical protein